MRDGEEYNSKQNTKMLPSTTAAQPPFSASLRRVYPRLPLSPLNGRTAAAVVQHHKGKEVHATEKGAGVDENAYSHRELGYLATRLKSYKV